jgi:hypothetical protein
MSRDQLDEILDSMNSMCWRCHNSEDWQEMDKLLTELDIKPLDTDVILAYLTTSAWARTKLTTRQAFVERSRAELLLRHPDRIQGLMCGLE